MCMEYRYTISTHALTWSATSDYGRLQTSRQHFNSRAHVERDPIQSEKCVIVRISTHALTWSATCCDDCSLCALPCISTHALTWSATPDIEMVEGEMCISTHALTWSATHIHFNAEGRQEFQLTRSRGARPTLVSSRSSEKEISTHALTWSATACHCFFHQHSGISTHALTWSATRSQGGFRSSSSHFNSRAHVERDHHR